MNNFLLYAYLDDQSMRIPQHYDYILWYLNSTRKAHYIQLYEVGVNCEQLFNYLDQIEGLKSLMIVDKIWLDKVFKSTFVQGKCRETFRWKISENIFSDDSLIVSLYISIDNSLSWKEEIVLAIERYVHTVHNRSIVSKKLLLIK